ncbi:MAG: molecular chaperone HtpG [Rickettsiales bacterium]|nr:molecular chaperone HtpG [Rickettsiales bacterium]
MTKQTLKFSAETDKVFNLMVHSLYQNKDIVLRELISNASDACDKLRYLAIQQPDLLGADELKIKIELDKKNRLLKISDNGIGMTRENLIENLGTIARSGTQKFLENIANDNFKDNQLIGQFGVGFYSAFMIADNVNVISQYAGETKAHIWNSKGDGEFTIEESSANIGRGTIITLHIKPEEDDFLDKFHLKNIIDNYSNHIAFKIYFKDAESPEILVNEGKALWLKNKNEITNEEYEEFYKSLSHLGDDKPFLTIHNKAEGLVEYNSLLFVPSKKPFDLYHPDRITRLKLYIKRVLISENLDVIPAYLRFIRGVVDSNDLPLNISRETIQNNNVMQKIKTSITKKILKELSNKLTNDRENYNKFWQNFGAVLKEGLCDGLEPRDEILEACLFQTNKSEEFISLKQYIENIKENQKAIYYINSPDRKTGLDNPQLEGFVKRGFEVIILTDSVDDFWVNVLHEYKGHKFKSVIKSGDDLEEIKTENAENKNPQEENTSAENKGNLNNLINLIKEVLGDKISSVKKTNKLYESPACLSVPEGAMDIRLERFLVENKQIQTSTAKIFEINPEHNIIKKLAKIADDSKNNNSQDLEKAKNLILLLFAEANITEGEPVPDIKHFTSNLNKLIEASL